MRFSHPFALLVLCTSLLIIFTPISPVKAITAASVPSSYFYSFNAAGTLIEAGSDSTSRSGYWWLSSGGKMPIQNSVGKTVQGSLPTTDPWRVLYNKNNPLDTDNGYHPQNIFRLVSRSQWDDVRIEAKYKINRDNFSASPNRNASNGLLLMSRYKDQNSLYYAGVRVDGKAIIKKKKDGAYTTLAEKTVFPGSYSIEGNVNLIPHNTWLSLRSDTITNTDGSVTVRLYMRKAGEIAFTKILEAKDNSNPITGAGYAGIRTDFMDVEFDSFQAIDL